MMDALTGWQLFLFSIGSPSQTRKQHFVEDNLSNYQMMIMKLSPVNSPKSRKLKNDHFFFLSVRVPSINGSCLWRLSGLNSLS
jgi:hypothetical protein